MRNSSTRLLAHPAALFLARTLILLAVLALWECASGRWLPRIWISSPNAIFAMLQRWVRDSSLWRHVGATLLASGVGYAIAAPFVAALHALPKVALAPLLVIVFGIGLESKVVLVAAAVFFLLLYGTLDGAGEHHDQRLEDGSSPAAEGSACVSRSWALPSAPPTGPRSGSLAAAGVAVPVVDEFAWSPAPADDGSPTRSKLLNDDGLNEPVGGDLSRFRCRIVPGSECACSAEGGGPSISLPSPLSRSNA